MKDLACRFCVWDAICRERKSHLSWGEAVICVKGMRLQGEGWPLVNAGAIAWDLDDTVHTAGPRMGVLFFENVILSLLPFSYMSIYYADRQFYAADVASGLYHPSAYYVAQSLVCKPP